MLLRGQLNYWNQALGAPDDDDQDSGQDGGQAQGIEPENNLNAQPDDQGFGGER